MQPYSDYEIAQRRIERWQNRKTQFRTAVFILITAIFVSVVGGSANVCSIPIALLAFICAIILRINLYYTSPENVPSVAETNKEIAWLLGEKQHDFSIVQIRAVAQDRIQKRGIRQWRFLGHLLIFIPINGAIFLLGLQTLVYYIVVSDLGFGLLLLIIAFTWLFILILDFQRTFPDWRQLEKQERRFGQTLQLELERLQTEKSKVKEKLKRGKYYQVGDDGELEEVEDEVVLLEVKPKREAKG